MVRSYKQKKALKEAKGDAISRIPSTKKPLVFKNQWGNNPNKRLPSSSGRGRQPSMPKMPWDTEE